MTTSTEPNPLFRQAAWVYLGLAVGALCWIGVRTGTIATDVIAGSRWWVDVGIGLAAGGGFLLLWEVVRRVSPAARGLEAALAGALGPLRRDEALALALLSAVAEELFFRGAMLPAWGLLASSVFFALLHVGPGRQYLPWTLAALLAGATFGSLTLWRGGILAALVAHFVVNAVQLPRYARGLGPQSEVGQGTE